MAARTIQQLFGTNASVSNGVLSVPLADLSGTGLNGANPTAAEIATALVKQWKATQSTGATDENDNGVTVGDPFKSFVTRGNQSQIEYQYPVSFYVPDSTSELDPDDVVG